MEHPADPGKVCLIDLEFIGPRGTDGAGFRGTPLYAGTQHLRMHSCSRGDDLDALGQMAAQWAGYDLPWTGLQIEVGNRDTYERYAAAKELEQWADLNSAPAGSLGCRLRAFIAAARALPPDAAQGCAGIDYAHFEELLSN